MIPAEVVLLIVVAVAWLAHRVGYNRGYKKALSRAIEVTGSQLLRNVVARMGRR